MSNDKDQSGICLKQKHRTGSGIHNSLVTIYANLYHTHDLHNLYCLINHEYKIISLSCNIFRRQTPITDYEIILRTVLLKVVWVGFPPPPSVLYFRAHPTVNIFNQCDHTKLHDTIFSEDKYNNRL